MRIPKKLKKQQAKDLASLINEIHGYLDSIGVKNLDVDGPRTDEQAVREVFSTYKVLRETNIERWRYFDSLSKFQKIMLRWLNINLI